MARIYLDHNATTPLAAEAAAAMQPFLMDAFGNASSQHWAGERVRAAVANARQRVANLLHCQPEEIVFTSGGTEANNAALAGVFFRQPARAQPQIIISGIEHPSIANPCAFLERLGARITRVPVDRFGVVDVDALRRSVTADTVLISVMHANNEVGTLQPIREIASIARKRGILMHTDAAQSLGKVDVNVAELGVDLLSVAGHKMYAPQGVGALYVREGVVLEPFMRGAGHEQGRRAGTENVAAIVALGAACEIAPRWIEQTAMVELRDLFWNRLQEHFGDRVVLNGHPTQRLPNTLNVGFLGRQGHEMLARLPELAASTGSACHSGDHQPSAVLTAMGISASEALGAIRFSLGRHTTRDEVEMATELLAKVGYQ